MGAMLTAACRTTPAAGAAALAVGVAVAAGARWLQRLRPFRCSSSSSLPERFRLESVVRPSVLRVKSYAFPPRFEYSDPVLLDANESPYGPPCGDATLARLRAERYPDPRYGALKEAFAGLARVKAGQVLLGNGSDEVIDMLIRVFCSPGSDSILVCPPTYSMYGIFAEFNDVGVTEVPLTPDFQLRPAEVVAALTPQTRLVFLCSPGNPTGNCLDREAMEEVLKAATGSVVVVDEAYADFQEGETALPLLAKYPNLFVMRTMSKAWGLAGARVGVAFAGEELIATMNVVRSPFNVSSLAEDAALRALASADTVASNIRKTVAERERVAAELRSMAPKVGRVYPSDANFLLLRVPDAKAMAVKIASDSNIVVRYRGTMLHCQDCIRVTIGTPAENDQFLRALRAALA